MALVTADRVRDTSTTTGTGAFTVSGTAPQSYRTFSAVCSTNDTFYYAIEHATGSEWECGLATYSAANTITRTTVHASSNSGSAVNFTAGTKNVYLAFTTAQIATLGGIANIVEDTTPQLGGMLDVNGFAIGDGTLELIKFVETAGAVNEITVTNAATGGRPKIAATGDDTNINLDISSKGAGNVHLQVNGTTRAAAVSNTWSPGADDGSALGSTSLKWSDLFLASGGVINCGSGDATITHSTGLWTSNVPLALPALRDANGELILDFTEAATPVNYGVLHNAATGAYPQLEATGSDASVGWEFDTKGAGSHRFFIGGTKKLELFAGAAAPGTTGGYNLGSASLVFGEVHSSSYEFGGFTDSTLARLSAGKLGVEGNAILMKGVTETLTAGYSVTPYNAGTKSSGTYTPAESDGAFQYATNNGAHTLAPPTNNTSIVVQYTNGASAGAITTSGFTEVSGESFTTTNGDDFMCFITKNNGFSTLHVRALQ